MSPIRHIIRQAYLKSRWCDGQDVSTSRIMLAITTCNVDNAQSVQQFGRVTVYSDRRGQKLT